MSREPIIGSGFKGAEFEKKGLQERNLENLLELFDTKKVSESIDKLSKIRPENWERLAESTRAIIGMAGAMDPNIVSQLTDTVTEYFDSKLDAMIAEWLAPYLPQIMDFLDIVILPFLDGILIGFSEIFSGFAGIRAGSAELFRRFRLIHERRMLDIDRAIRMIFYRESFFPAMDTLYAGREGFITDEDIIAEQDALRGGGAGGSQGGIPTPPVSDPFGELEDI